MDEALKKRLEEVVENTLGAINAYKIYLPRGNSPAIKHIVFYNSGAENLAYVSEYARELVSNNEEYVKLNQLSFNLLPVETFKSQSGVWGVNVQAVLESMSHRDEKRTKRLVF